MNTDLFLKVFRHAALGVVCGAAFGALCSVIFYQIVEWISVSSHIHHNVGSFESGFLLVAMSAGSIVGASLGGAVGFRKN